MVTTDEQFQAWFLLNGNGRAIARRLRALADETNFYDRGSPEGEFEFDADVDVHGEYNEQRDRHKDTVKMWDKANEKYELLRAELIRKAPAADKALLTAMVPSPTVKHGVRPFRSWTLSFVPHRNRSCTIARLPDRAAVWRMVHPSL